MADEFQDPRIAGSLDALNAELERIARNVEEADRKATERDRERRAREERGRRPAQPGRARAAEPTLDEQVRVREAAEGEAAAQERATRAQKERARVTERQARQERFITEQVGKRSAIVRDITTGEQVGPRFRGGLPKDAPDPRALDAATRKAQQYADNLNRAGDAVERTGRELIRHPELFGRQVYTPTRGPAPLPVRREFAARAVQPPGGVAAAQERQARAQIEYEAAKKAQAAAVRKGTTAEVTAANQRRELARAEVAASNANLSAVRQETAARQAHAARLRVLGGEEAFASRRGIQAQVDYSQFLRGQQRLLQRRQLQQLVDFDKQGQAQRRLMERTFPPTTPRLPTTGFGIPEAGPVREAAGGTLRGVGVGAAGPIRDTGDAAQTAGRQVRGYADSVAYSAREIDLAGNAARRNGALTTEFIEAAARGRTTIRELGFQVGATIGKFAGWTAAATAVFGAAAAIAELGRGAIDTAEGVNNLTRIIPNLDREAAAQGIQDLAQRFNLPIGDVADAAYGISKTFGSIRNPAEALDATLKSTTAVLFAMKVGELDVATATRYLTSIIQGFQLDADEMPDLLDAINEAQNRFGGNVGQITQGVAQAAGAFDSAGGNYRELIALIQTGSRVTGRTGAEIGTALRRSAEIYQRPERRQTIMDLLGIDPRTSTIVQVFERAMQVVRGAAPELQAQVAKAISTPELASGRVLPILRSGALYREISAGIAPGAAKDSAAKELERALRGPREQIQRLRTDLQVLGSELATAGFLDPFIAMVKVLDRALRILTGIVELVGELPGPLRLAAAYAVPLGAALGLARRFDVGGGRGPLGRGRGATTRANILTGLDAERQAIGGERVARATELRSASLRVSRIDRELATLVGDEEETLQRRSALVDRRGVLVRQIEDVEDDLNGLHAQEQQVMRQRRAVLGTRLRGERQVIAAYQAEGGYYAQPQLDRPYAGGPVGVGQPFVDQTRGPQAPYIPAGGAFIDPTRGPQARAAQQLVDQQNKLARYGAQFNAAMRPLGTSGRLLGAVGQRAGQAGSAAAAGLANAARGLGAGAGALAGMIGPLDLIILGVVAYISLQQLMSQKTDEIEQQARAMEQAIGSESLAARIKEAQKNVDSGGTQMTSFLEEAGNAFKGIKEALPFVGGGGLGDLEDTFKQFDPGSGVGIQRIFEGVQTAEERQRKAIAAQRKRLAYQRREAEHGRLLYQGQIRQQLRAEFGEAETDAQRREAIERAQRQYRESYFSKSERLKKRPGARAAAAQTRDLIAQLRGEAAATAQTVNAFRRELAAVDDAASAESLVQNLQVRISRRGIFATLPRVAQSLQRLRQLVTESSGEERQKRIQALMTLQDDALTRIETVFQRQLASGEVSPQRARRRYLSTAAMILFGVRTLDELRELQDRRRRLRALIRTARAVMDRLERQAGEAIGEMAASELGERTREGHRRLDRLNRLLSKLGPSPTRDDLDAFRDLSDQSQEAVDQVLEEGRKSDEDRLQEAISIFQSRQRNASARALIGASQGARLQRAVADANAFLGFLRSQRGVDEAQILDAQTAVFEAQDALAQFVEEQAQALVRARSAFAQSRTTDPIKQALIRLQEAQQLLQFAETPAERLEGLAEINNRRRELQQTRQQERVDEQQFLFDIGKITQEQYESWIRRFLRTHRHLRKTNRELFRQLKRMLHQFEQETDSDMDLQVGDIRLPTLYDVRRIARQGTQTAPRPILNQNNTYTINGATDPEAVASAIGSRQRTTTKSAARAAD